MDFTFVLDPVKKGRFSKGVLEVKNKGFFLSLFCTRFCAKRGVNFMKMYLKPRVKGVKF